MSALEKALLPTQTRSLHRGGHMSSHLEAMKMHVEATSCSLSLDTPRADKNLSRMLTARKSVSCFSLNLRCTSTTQSTSVHLTFLLTWVCLPLSMY